MFVSTFITLFFLLTPFFVLSSFLALTRDLSTRDRHILAVKVTVAVIIVGSTLYLFGNYIFAVFAITLPAFRIGTGVLLMLSAISLVQGRDQTRLSSDDGDISVVPLAIPITVGPASTGYLLVLAGDRGSTAELLLTLLALVSASVVIGVLLYVGSWIEKALGKRGLTILTKVTGLILSALAAQVFMTGLLEFLG